MSTSKEDFVRLLDLRNQAGATLHQRLVLANKLLSDKEWVDDPTQGGGDESRAIDRLEEECFGDCGGMPLPEMLEVLHQVPELSVWKRNKFNLRKMSAELKARQDAKRNAKRGATIPPVPVFGTPAPETSQDETKRLKLELKEAHTRIRELMGENRKLRRAVHRLQQAVGDLQTVGAG